MHSQPGNLISDPLTHSPTDSLSPRPSGHGSPCEGRLSPPKRYQRPESFAKRKTEIIENYLICDHGKLSCGPLAGSAAPVRKHRLPPQPSSITIRRWKSTKTNWRLLSHESFSANGAHREWATAIRNG